MDFSHGPEICQVTMIDSLSHYKLFFSDKTLKVAKDRKIPLAHGTFEIRVAKEAAGADHRNIKDLRKLLATNN